MKKRMMSMLLALTMVLSLLPTAVWAEDTDAPEAPQCICTEACTADLWNADCPLCSAADATPEDCGCYATEDMELTEEEQQLLESDQSTLSLGQQGNFRPDVSVTQSLEHITTDFTGTTTPKGLVYLHPGAGRNLPIPVLPRITQLPAAPVITFHRSRILSFS